MNKLELPTWLPMKKLRHWRHYAEHTPGVREQMQAQFGVRAKRVILSVAHGGAIPEVDDVETSRWLKGLSLESRLLRWVACSDFLVLHKQFIDENRSWPENSTSAYWWQTLEDRVLRCVEDVVFASTSSHLSLHFDGFMVHRDNQLECTTAEFLNLLDQRLMETTGFIIPFVVKEHFSFTQLLRARAGQDDRVLPVEHQGEHGVNMLISPCTLAAGFATSMWTNASCAVYAAPRIGGCLTMRQWMDAFNEKNHGNPTCACPSIGFHPPAEVEGSAVLVVFEDFGLEKMFWETSFVLLLLSWWSPFSFFQCSARFGNS